VTSLAHEWGHHIQHLLGVVDAKGTIDSLSPDTQPLTSREVELQADCYAGLFSRYARDTGWLSDHDLAEAMAVRERVGDFEVSNPGHHGTPEQRREWFLRGFIHYSMRACETW
jgi:predicted metalloprotease